MISVNKRSQLRGYSTFPPPDRSMTKKRVTYHTELTTSYIHSWYRQSVGYSRGVKVHGCFSASKYKKFYLELIGLFLKNLVGTFIRKIRFVQFFVTNDLYRQGEFLFVQIEGSRKIIALFLDKGGSGELVCGERYIFSALVWQFFTLQEMDGGWPYGFTLLTF